MTNTNILHSSKTPEWYTPPSIINLATQCLGQIDLDPASNPTAQQWINADRYYTQSDDGLTKDWHGKIWLNPPYGNGITNRWVSKLINEYESGNVTEAIALLRAAVSSSWFNKLASSYPRCETFKRIRFVDAHGVEQASPAHGNVFFYLGKNTKRFTDVFSEIGIISTPIIEKPISDRAHFLFSVFNNINNNKKVLLSENLNGLDFKTYLLLQFKLQPLNYMTLEEHNKAIAKLASLDLLPEWFTSQYTPYSKSGNWTLILNSGGMQDTLTACVNQLYLSLTHEHSRLKGMEDIPENKNDFIDQILETGLWKGNIAFIWSHDHPDFEMYSYPPGWSQKFTLIPKIVVQG